MNEQDLHRLVEHLQQTLGERLEAVVRFGSRARGEAHPESDWDLLVVVRGLPQRPLKRWKVWLQVAPEPWRTLADPLLYTPEEWYGRVVPLTLDIALDGRVLYDARGRMQRFLASVRKRLRELGLTRREVQDEMLWVRGTGSPLASWQQRLEQRIGPQIHIQTDYGDEAHGLTPWELFSEEDAREALAIARRVVEEAARLIQEQGGADEA